MACSTSQSCHERGVYIAVRVPLLALTFLAGPILWSWLLHRRQADGRSKSLRFLTASYRAETDAWEAIRLAKNMVLKCAVALSPISYCAGQQLILVLGVMFFCTASHLQHQPCRFQVLNHVEAITLGVLNIGMMAASLVVSGSWFMSKDFAQQLTVASYSLLAVIFLGLAFLVVWAKLVLHDDHKLLKP
ncbi:unnamed protein product [Prorocentrum cordatum]|uniref:Solute carrier family 40 protein n=1 Tax=Prorocentrum cordatum TaxID=2364126 RepID=A0ABN9SWF0_9DINO|nr:unnamed protein product [Polarella glacialis]